MPGGYLGETKRSGAAQEKAGPSEEATTKEKATQEVKRLKLHNVAAKMHVGSPWLCRAAVEYAE